MPFEEHVKKAVAATAEPLILTGETASVPAAEGTNSAFVNGVNQTLSLFTFSDEGVVQDTEAARAAEPEVADEVEVKEKPAPKEPAAQVSEMATRLHRYVDRVVAQVA